MTIEKKNYIFGYIKINIVSNNIFITLTDRNGKVLFKYNGGSLKFKGRRKKNPYVASQLIKLLFSNLLKSSIFINFLIIDIKNFIKEKEMYNIISEFATYSKIPDSDDNKNRFKKNKNKY